MAALDEQVYRADGFQAAENSGMGTRRLQSLRWGDVNA
jgi:hypothetical protein